MRATVFNLGNRVGVCHFRRDGKIHVAEVDMETMRVLPQSVRVVVERGACNVTLDLKTTDQDVVDRATLGLIRFRSRLGKLPRKNVDKRRWLREARAARKDLDRLIERNLR